MKSTIQDGGRKMPDSEAKREWIKKNSTLVTAKLMRKGDDDIIAYLEGKKNSTVIKKALRLLMETEGVEYINKKPTEDEQEG